MPLGYGSIFELPKLSKIEVGVLPSDNNQSSFWGILRIVLTIAEIGIALATNNEEILPNLLTGLEFGAANELIDSETGSLDITGTLLNFLPPVLAGGFGAIRNFTKVNRFIEASQELATPFEKEAKGEARELSSAFRRGTRIANKIEDNPISNFQKFNKGLGALPYNKKAITNISDFAISDINKSRISGESLQTFKSTSSFPKRGFITNGIEDKKFMARLSSLGFSREEIKDLGELGLYSLNTDKLSLGDFDEFRSLLQKIKVNHIGTDLETFVNTFESGFQNLMETNLTKATMKAGHNKNDINSFIRAIEEPIFTQDMVLSRALNDAWSEVAPKQGLFQRFKYIVKHPGSAKFNDKIVQPIQAILDPNDAGRAGVEFLYRNAKREITFMFKKLSRTIKEISDLEEKFRKAGGWIFDSSWILGIRPLSVSLPGKSLYLIKFRKESTNNKRDVIVWLSNIGFRKFVVAPSPGRYYLHNIAVARGRMGGVIGEINGVLGFLHINALRNILSLVSNGVENISQMAKGTYFGGEKNKDGTHKAGTSWSEKFIKSMSNSAISRTFRLLGNVAIGGAVREFGNKELGRFIGREAQRIGTQIFAKGIKNVRNGESFGKGLGRSVATGALTSLKSNALRALRRRSPNNVIVNSLSARRKLQVLGRIPNAMTPGRNFNDPFVDIFNKDKWKKSYK